MAFCLDMTFDATINPVAYEDGETAFIDTEYDTWTMDPAALEKAFEIYPAGKFGDVSVVSMNGNKLITGHLGESVDNLPHLEDYIK